MAQKNLIARGTAHVVCALPNYIHVLTSVPSWVQVLYVAAE